MAKKFLSLALALVMCLGLCAPALASEEEEEKTFTTPGGRFEIYGAQSQGTDKDGTPLYWASGREGCHVIMNACGTDLKEGETFTVESWQADAAGQPKLVTRTETISYANWESVPDYQDYSVWVGVSMSLAGQPETYTEERAARVTFRGESVYIGFVDEGAAVSPKGNFVLYDFDKQETASDGTPLYWISEKESCKVYFTDPALKAGGTYRMESWTVDKEDDHKLVLQTEEKKFDEDSPADAAITYSYSLWLSLDTLHMAAIPESYTAEKATRITYKGETIAVAWTEAGPRTATSGECGENAAYLFNNKGLFAVSGTGPMKDYDYEFPWMNMSVMLPFWTVSFAEGITSVGAYSFHRTGVETLILPKSVTRIGDSAFDRCEKLKDVYYAGSEADWKKVTIEPNNDALLNAAMHYNSTGPEGGAAPVQPVPSPAPAVPASSTVLVNGKQTAFDAYNIGGNNYFKLRDLAYVLSGTAKQFEVGWDGAANAISLTSGQPYTAVGGEMSAKGSGTKQAKPSTAKILLDGREISLTAYEIGGNNYFKLRDIGQTFDFGVGWDDASRTVTIDTSAGYTAG